MLRSLATALLLSAVSAREPGPAALRAQPVDRSVFAMGTRLDFHLTGAVAATLSHASEAAVREVERVEAACSTWRPASSWSVVNHAGGRSVPLALEWRKLLRVAIHWQRETAGAFDPVLGALMRAWDIRGAGRLPSAAELSAARDASGAGLLTFDDAGGTVRLNNPAAALEEGGFVKGYALDRALLQLRALGARRGVLNFGGQLLVFGGPQRVEVSDPADRGRPVMELTLHDASLSSSGTSEHGRHILNPATGEPSPAWGCVSVVMPSALEADILSTALYVMGPQRGLHWADEHHVAAFFQTVEGKRSTSVALGVLSPHLLPSRSPRSPN